MERRQVSRRREQRKERGEGRRRRGETRSCQAGAETRSGPEGKAGRRRQRHGGGGQGKEGKAARKNVEAEARRVGLREQRVARRGEEKLGHRPEKPSSRARVGGRKGGGSRSLGVTEEQGSKREGRSERGRVKDRVRAEGERREAGR